MVGTLRWWLMGARWRLEAKHEVTTMTRGFTVVKGLGLVTRSSVE